MAMLSLHHDCYEYPSAIKALSRAKHENALDALPALASKAAASLAPVDHCALIDRLTLLGMSMAAGKDSDQIKAWLHETARLLADLPQGVLFDAIDECVKEPGRVFTPSVGEIRDKAAEPLRRREREAARLRRLANMVAEGIEIPDWTQAEPWADHERTEPVCTPDQAAEILAEFGLKGSLGDKVAGMLVPEQPKTRADYIAEGRDPPPLKPEQRDPWAMMC